MNRNSLGSFTLSKAITGYLNYKTAEGMAQRTLICMSVSWSSG